MLYRFVRNKEKIEKQNAEIKQIELEKGYTTYICNIAISYNIVDLYN